ncbi:hypothetical protein IQ07DRAFT_402873 [Pyrenochaeta sp. DS3sAY3a]|nr:hypothetical protein IQ07DRAFT_402873 [Pyrenochaeta sp. DS3sAY3a]
MAKAKARELLCNPATFTLAEADTSGLAPTRRSPLALAVLRGAGAKQLHKAVHICESQAEHCSRGSVVQVASRYKEMK